MEKFEPITHACMFIVMICNSFEKMRDDRSGIDTDNKQWTINNGTKLKILTFLINVIVIKE